MARRSASPVVRFFDSSKQRVFNGAQLQQITHRLREEGHVPGNWTFVEVLELLENDGHLRKIELPAESDYPSITRYVWRDPSPFELALSLKANAYLSHSTAAFLHGLTDQVPHTLYSNREQSAKPKPSGGLTQESLDRAFRVQQRTSNLVYTFDDYRIVVLHGKHSDYAGVIEFPTADGLSLRTTDIDRTLVDLVVRPSYGGGAHEVLSVFKRALPKVSVSRIIAVLRNLDYVYPYHQAIGFYLERAGASGKPLDRLRSMGMNHKFYLVHGMESKALDKTWNLWYPKDL